MPCGPSEGCGSSRTAGGVRADGKALIYWKTKYPKLTLCSAYTVPTSGANEFGTNYVHDISAIDPPRATAS